MISRWVWFYTLVFFGMVFTDSVADLRNPYGTLAVVVTYCAIGYLLIKWANAYDPIPEANMAWAIFWGAGVAPMIVMMAYDELPFFDTFITPSAALEELAKATILIAAFKLKLINNWVHGFVYGALSGLGFTLSEDMDYALWSFAEIETATSRGFDSAFGHPLFSGVVGAICAYAWLNRSKLLLLVGLLTGTALHTAWNGFVWRSAEGLPLALVLANPTLFLCLVIGARESRKRLLVGVGQLSMMIDEIDQVTFSNITNLRQRKISRNQCSGSVDKLEFDLEISNEIRRITKFLN
jgi:RsiW-degrading membrane proteinase PrsW (M82 family)